MLIDVSHRFVACCFMFDSLSTIVILSCDRVSNMSDCVRLPSQIPNVAEVVQAATDTRCGQEELVQLGAPA